MLIHEASGIFSHQPVTGQSPSPDTRQACQAARRPALLGLLPPARQVPAVDMADADAQVGGEPEPAEIRHHAPGRDGVDGAPEVGEVGVGGDEGEDVGGRGHGPPQAEEQRGPDEVQRQLGRVDGGGVPRGGDDGGRGEGGGGAEGPGAVRGVAHQAVEDGPYRAEDPVRRGQGWLAEGGICLFCLLVWVVLAIYRVGRKKGVWAGAGLN